MILFLVTQIKLGRITIDDVPGKYRAAVSAQIGGEDNG